MSKNIIQNINAKILDADALKIRIANWRSEGYKIVFTNGCFDLLHMGHISYLAAAAELGDKLIIGLNSDASIQRLKGANRPIKDLQNRQFILASLLSVDAVIPFEEDTPIKLIEKVLPDFLVKGGDWKPDQIVGSELVLQNGGEVLSLPFIEGHSTTSLVEKIADQTN